MKRFIFSAFSVLIATSAIAYEAQALPKVDPAAAIQTRRLQEFDARNKGVSPSFELQKLRLQEFDARSKSEDYQQPYYSETSAQEAAYEEDSAQSIESTPVSTQWQSNREDKWESAGNQPAEADTELSLIERRHQLLDRD